MSAKHTQGPWTATITATQTVGVNVSFWVEGADRLSICSGQSQEHLQTSNAINEDECRANARLISAAPDLLEALEELVRANEEWNSAVEQIVGRPATWTDEYLSAARAAIAKARGQS